MRKVLRGYAKERDDNLILIGTIPAPLKQGQSLSKGLTDREGL